MKFAENVMTVEGNAVFEETVKMSVQNDSISHIIKSLTDMYSNPVLAMSREYLSNAYDATVSRMSVNSSFGTVLDTPIEVTLPSSLNPNFVIRDYGIGMDRDILANVFPQYGASTKRGNNNEIGGFGLGAKSALAVVSNFTAISVKNGKKNTAIIQKGSDGVGEVSFLPEQDTNEPSGTTITITLPNPQALNSVFRDSNLLLGFPHGSILMNGKMHENSVFNTEIFTKIGEDGWVLNSLLDWEDGRSSRRSYVGSRWERIIVVGPISYRVTEKDLQGDYEESDIFGADTAYTVLNLPIGSVDFTPARENLIFSDRTCKAIVDTAKRLTQGVNEHLQAGITKAPSMKAAARRADNLRNDNFSFDFTYNGETIPTMTMDSLAVTGKDFWQSDRNAKVTPQETKFIAGRYYHYSRTQTAVIVTGVETVETAKVLNRLRKPFADRHGSDISSESLTVLYTSAAKSELSKWAGALVAEIFTADEWEAKGIGYRKEINEERKAKRMANGGSSSNSTYGAVPVSILRITGNRWDKPKLSGAYAADVARYDTVVYIQTNKTATDTMTHKFAKTLTAGEDNVFSVEDMNFALRAVESHSNKDSKTVTVVRVPANTKIETFLKVVPQAVSLDEALKALAKEIIDNKDDLLAIQMSADSRSWDWLTGMNFKLDEVENDELRDYLKRASDVHTLLTGRGGYEASVKASAISTKSHFVTAKSFDFLFEDFNKASKASADRFKLPLLNSIRGNSFAAADAVQYMNLMYPVAVTA